MGPFGAQRGTRNGEGSMDTPIFACCNSSDNYSSCVPLLQMLESLSQSLARVLPAQVEGNYLYNAHVSLPFIILNTLIDDDIDVDDDIPMDLDVSITIILLVLILASLSFFSLFGISRRSRL